MKIAFVALALLGVLRANPLNHDLPDDAAVDAYGPFVEPKPEVFPNFEEEAAESPATRPPNPSATYPSKSRPPQIHHNVVLSQGPFSGRLINVLVNEKGVQETAQKNRIEYNIKGVAKTFVDDFEKPSV